MWVKDGAIDSFQCVDIDEIAELKKESICYIQRYYKSETWCFQFKFLSVLIPRYLTESVG